MKKKLMLETRCCAGYGYYVYAENGMPDEVVEKLKKFSMWGGSTKTYQNHKAYELTEERMHVMQTVEFREFLEEHNVELITDKDDTYDACRELIANIK